MRKKQVVLNRKKDSDEVKRIEVKAQAKTAKTSAPKADSKAKAPVNVNRMKSKYANFADFKMQCKNLDNKVAFTLHENRILLVARTLENHLKAIIEFRTATKEYKNNKHIMNVSKLRNHIKWLQDRNFVFNTDKQKKVKIVNYVKA